MALLCLSTIGCVTKLATKWHYFSKLKMSITSENWVILAPHINSCTLTHTHNTHTYHIHHTHFHCSWFCHVDDDIYVNLKVLVQTLAKFYPRKEPIYLGRSGSSWRRPRQVKQSAKLGRPGQGYHFAVGGMYCLSRAMLEGAKPYLV